MKSLSGLVLLAAIIIVGLVATVTISSSRLGSAKPSPSAPTLNKAGKAVQLGYFTPATPVPTLAPTTAPITTPQPSSPDFSASTLDWEDVYLVLNWSGQLSQLSSSCLDDLMHATTDETGDTTGIINISLIPTSTSRIALCWKDRNCQENGYDHYSGSIPLPSSAPSPQCQTELKSIFPSAIQSIPPSITNIDKQQIINDVDSPNATNCDVSDAICIPHNQLCQRIQIVGGSLPSLCP